jgi:hypothetical protein
MLTTISDAKSPATYLRMKGILLEQVEQISHVGQIFCIVDEVMQ